MNTKHTPGPWELECRGWDGQFIYGIDERAKGRRFIAEVDLNYDGAEANASLIAAAPELLESLIELRDAYQEFMKLPAFKANAAIAKATGK